jgi:hypothetical protein
MSPDAQSAPPRLCGLLPCIVLVAGIGTAKSVDSPEAPDEPGAFQQRSAPYRQAVEDAAGGASNETAALIAFLLRALRQAENALQAAPPAAERRALLRAQSTS